jgi:hypothetical protein
MNDIDVLDEHIYCSSETLLSALYTAPYHNADAPSLNRVYSVRLFP